MDIKCYQVNEKTVEIKSMDNALEVNGKVISAQYIPQSNGQVKFILDDQVISYEVITKNTKGITLAKDGKEYFIQKQSDTPATQIAQADLTPQTSGIQIKAPLPGVVVKVAIQNGDAIKKNDVLLVVESMKMQIDVRSTVAGLVKKILVKTGDQVDVDMPVVEIE